MQVKRNKLFKLLAAVGVVLLLMRYFGLLSGKPAPTGVVDGRLASCPASPNCVCTFDTDPQHAMAPLSWGGSAEAAIERLRRIVLEQPRTRIVTAGENYLHAEFTSLMFGFVDDVEFLIDAESQRIHFRSASRLGRSDLGTNRRRMERIRQAWETLPER